jgi:predicted RNase H-like nuclease (RuvC/YqgF family)
MREAGKRDVHDNTKKISVILDIEMIRQIEDKGQTQTDAIKDALRFYLAGGPDQIKSYEKQIQEDREYLLVLESRTSELTNSNDTLKKELDRVHSELERVNDLMQVITRIEGEMKNNQEKILLLEDNIRQKEDQILLLEDTKKKGWMEKLTSHFKIFKNNNM